MNAAVRLASDVGVQPACEALGVDRASFYRHRPILGGTVSRVRYGYAPVVY